jgi:hypothetical protein
MKTRDLAPVLRDSLKRYPIVTVTGPRQAGKTTLARAEVDKPYVNLERPILGCLRRKTRGGFWANIQMVRLLTKFSRCLHY